MQILRLHCGPGESETVQKGQKSVFQGMIMTNLKISQPLAECRRKKMNLQCLVDHSHSRHEARSIVLSQQVPFIFLLISPNLGEHEKGHSIEKLCAKKEKSSLLFPTFQICKIFQNYIQRPKIYLALNFHLLPSPCFMLKYKADAKVPRCCRVWKYEWD